jgi:hypothetical protein
MRGGGSLEVSGAPVSAGTCGCTSATGGSFFFLNLHGMEQRRWIGYAEHACDGVEFSAGRIDATAFDGTDDGLREIGALRDSLLRQLLPVSLKREAKHASLLLQ